MASLGLEPEELKAIEQTRVRLSLLENSIRSLQTNILHSNPLPSAYGSGSYSSTVFSDCSVDRLARLTVLSSSDNLFAQLLLQASAQILQRNLQSLVDILAEHGELFQRVVVHPSSNFPGRAHENVLTSLLRKKPEPVVEAWAARGRDAAAAAAAATPGGLDALRAVWDEARTWCLDRVAAYIRTEAADPFTSAERASGVASVRTGLRRELDDEADDDDDDDDDEDDNEDEDEDDGQIGESDPVPSLDFPSIDSSGDVIMDDLGQAVPPSTAATTPAAPEPELLLFFATRADFAIPVNIDYLSAARRPGSAFAVADGIGIGPSVGFGRLRP